MGVRNTLGCQSSRPFVELTVLIEHSDKVALKNLTIEQAISPFPALNSNRMGLFIVFQNPIQFLF
jgi:hypothetical protein